MTNNPRKIVGVQGHGLQVVERVPLEIEKNPGNQRYLETKKHRLGHLLNLWRWNDTLSGGWSSIPNWFSCRHFRPWRVPEFLLFSHLQFQVTSFVSVNSIKYQNDRLHQRSEKRLNQSYWFTFSISICSKGSLGNNCPNLSRSPEKIWGLFWFSQKN